MGAGQFLGFCRWADWFSRVPVAVDPAGGVFGHGFHLLQFVRGQDHGQLLQVQDGDVPSPLEGDV